MTMALLLTILGVGLFIFAIRTVNRWDGGRIPIQVHVMIGIVGVVVLLMGLYLLTAPQVPKSIPSDISLRAGLATPAAIGGASERAIMAFAISRSGHRSTVTVTKQNRTRTRTVKMNPNS
jgi:hypothetical protein